MLASFPELYPDELLYSACARYSDYTRYPNKRYVIQELFGTNSITAILDLPNRLQALVDVLPKGHHYTVDYLIDHHTLLSSYAPFLPTDRLSMIRRDMATGRGGAIHTRIGLMANRVHAHEFFQFCPVCRERDIATFGEPYWHRIHQVPGVLVCPEHCVLLARSIYPIRNNPSRHVFTSASKATYYTIPQALDLSDEAHSHLLAIAQDVEWLLSNSNICEGMEELSRRYLFLLAKRGFLTRRDSIRYKNLLSCFERYYSNDFLSKLDCTVDSHVSDNWLIRLARDTHEFCAPVQHLLFMHFLGSRAEDFFSVCLTEEPFGSGPWPCLNPVCEHYLRPAIQQYRVQWNYGHTQAVGTFMCECGYTYTRSRTIYEDINNSQQPKAICYGSKWLEKLQEMSTDSEMSLREKARRLGVDPATVKNYLNRLNKGTVQSELETVGNYHKPSEDLIHARQMWLKVVAEFPDAGVKTIRAKLPHIYTKLYRKDRIWLEAHLPQKKQKTKLKTQHVDWNRRDAIFAAQVYEIANELRESSDRPIHITAAAIARRMGKTAIIQKHLVKLPTTSNALTEVTESYEDYAIRRIKWVANSATKHNIKLSRWQLIKASGVGRLIGVKRVETALEEALRETFEAIR